MPSAHSVKKIIILFIASVSFFACADQEKKNDLSQFGSLEGKWVYSGRCESIIEDWQPAQGTSMTAYCYGLDGTDTITWDTVKIEQRGEEFFHITDISGQFGTNCYKFTGIKNDSFIFEDPGNDFPQRFVYYRKAGDTLYSRADGHTKQGGMVMENVYTKSR